MKIFTLGGIYQEIIFCSTKSDGVKNLSRFVPTFVRLHIYIHFSQYNANFSQNSMLGNHPNLIRGAELLKCLKYPGIENATSRDQSSTIDSRDKGKYRLLYKRE
ncbi:hypothetical protein Syun_014599 [Stephania yunnanensis]|uniref:Uncharacterized protein n=1 Tax=Stephania yunnanensis TaxID=152371 RepID=A0AAP0JJY9_9MAGN